MRTQNFENSDSEILNILREERLSLVQQGKRVFDLSMINPDIAPPRFLVDRLVEASTKSSNHRYGAARGIRRLREAFAAKYESVFGVALHPEREICVTSGTKDAFQMSLRVISDGLEGERKQALVGRPTYPAHLYAFQDLGIDYDFFELSGDVELLLGRIEERLNSRSYGVLVLNFPNNPTGLCLGAADVLRIVTLAERFGVYVINDFVYGEMVFGGQAAPSILATGRSNGAAAGMLLETYSLSKAYSVPGWRVGALLGSAAIVERVSQLKSRADYGLFLPIQLASALALTSREALVGPIVDTYHRRAKFLVKALLELGFEVSMPSAGCSVWAKSPKDQGLVESAASSPATNFVRSLLREKGLLLLPGTLFGVEYHEYVRFALVRPDEDLRSVVGVIAEFLESKATRGQDTIVDAAAGYV